MLSKHRADYRDSIRLKKFGKTLSILNEYVYTSAYVSQRMRELSVILLPIIEAITANPESNIFSPLEIELLLCLSEAYQELQPLPKDIQSIVGESIEDQLDKEKLRYLGNFKIVDEDGGESYKSLEQLNESDLDVLLKYISLHYDNNEHLALGDTNANMLAYCKWVTLNFDDIRKLILKIQSEFLSLPGNENIVSNEDKGFLSLHYSIPMQRIMRIQSLFKSFVEEKPENIYALKVYQNMQRVCGKTNLYATLGESLKKEELQKYSQVKYLVQAIYWVDMVGQSFSAEYEHFKEEIFERKQDKEKEKEKCSAGMFYFLEKIDESIDAIITILDKEEIYHKDIFDMTKSFCLLKVYMPGFFIALNENYSIPDERYECIRMARVSAYIKDKFIRALRNHFDIETNDIKDIEKIVMGRLQEKCVMRKEEDKAEKEEEVEEAKIGDGYAERDKVNECLIQFHLKSMLTNKNDKYMLLDQAVMDMMIEVVLQGIKAVKNQESGSAPSKASYLSFIISAISPSNRGSQDAARAAEFHRLIEAAPTLLDKIIILQAILSNAKDIAIQKSIAKAFSDLFGEGLSLGDLKSNVIKLIRFMVRSQCNETEVKYAFELVNIQINEIINSVNQINTLNNVAIVKDGPSTSEARLG